MKRIAILVTLCAASPAWASPPAERDAASAVVQAELVMPLGARENRRSRFSRVRMPPVARRVRILDEPPQKDATGATFLRFAIDTRAGLVLDEAHADWDASESGCVYLESRQVFIRRADVHYPAALLLGQKAPAAPPHICQAQPQVAAANSAAK